MKLSLQAALGSAAIIFSASGCGASAHRRRHHQESKRSSNVHGHAHSPRADEGVFKKRSDMCLFPDNEPNVVRVVLNDKNRGWAMSIDQECTPGKYCPFACKSGMVMAQWQPGSTYKFPESMNGGLFCNNETGEMEKPFPEKPCCVYGTGTVSVRKEVQGSMTWCQTVLPGNEEMNICTEIADYALTTLAVPNQNYWANTSAHYYINRPGSTCANCTWGTPEGVYGNWAPYVAGANTVANNDTYVQISWNPKWLELGHSASTLNFGLQIECEGQCNGLPCEIDPCRGRNKVNSNQAGVGADEGENQARFCVVTVSAGSSAVIRVFDASGNGEQGGGPVNVGGGDGKDGPEVPLEVPPKEPSKELGDGEEGQRGPSEIGNGNEGSNDSEHSAEEPDPRPLPSQEPSPAQESMAAQELPSNPLPELPSSAPAPAMPPPPTSAPDSPPTTTSEPSPTPPHPPPPPSPVTPKTTVTPTSSRNTMTSLATAASRNSTTSYTNLQTKSQPTLVPGIFHENSTAATGDKRPYPMKSRSSVQSASTVSGPQNNGSSGSGQAPSSGGPPKPQTGVADRQQGSAAVAGLIVAFVTVACF